MVKMVKKKKKIPKRTCVGCGQNKPKGELLRIVRTPERVVVVDKSGKMNGRGTYVCYSEECVNAAIKRKKINYALEVDIQEEEMRRIENDILLAIKNTVNVD